MDESAQQAISIGVNVTIFVVALTISLNLIFSVRNLANVAKEVNDSVADGSKQEAVEKHNEMIMTGYEVASYYYNYIKPYYETVYNHPNINVRVDTQGDGNSENDVTKDTSLTFGMFVKNLGLNDKYRLFIEKHYEDTGITDVVIQKVI